jgi:hypothetical protein
LEASLFSDFFAVSARKSNLTLKMALLSGGAVFCWEGIALSAGREDTIFGDSIPAAGCDAPVYWDDAR